MTSVSTEDIEPDNEIVWNSHITYEDLIKFPCMLETYELNFTDFEIADTLDDGRYIGSVEAVSEDGSMVYAILSEPVIFTEDEYFDLQVGDTIDVDFYGTDVLTITSVDESRTDYARITFDCENIWFDQGIYTENTTDYILMTDSQNPVGVNPKAVILPVASYCKITDSFGWLLEEDYEQDMADFMNKQDLDAPLANTTFWYYMATYQYRCESSNGWTPVWGCLYPTEVKSGQLTSMNLEWR